MKEELIPCLIKKLIDEIAEGQKIKLLKCGRNFVPTLTQEDVLQPNDYPILESNPHFRYEEGVLEGIQTVGAAIRCYFND